MRATVEEFLSTGGRAWFVISGSTCEEVQAGIDDLLQGVPGRTGTFTNPTLVYPGQWRSVGWVKLPPIDRSPHWWWNTDQEGKRR